MPGLSLVAILTGILLVLPVAFYLLQAMRKPPSTIIVHNTLSSIRNLLEPQSANRADLLAARAAPNKRLIRVFSLTNTFVSPHAVVHDTFVAHANSILRAAKKRGWHQLQQVAISAVDASLHDATSERDFNALVQDITLRVALVGLLDVNTNMTDFEACDINTVTTLITFLWSLSKTPEPIPNHHLDKLNFHLRRLVPDVEAFPNPLDFVIPVWETLWRVVATTIAYVHQDENFRTVFAAFHCRPKLDQFQSFVEGSELSGPSVECLVMESMRLQPPSRHLTRLTKFPSITDITTSSFLPIIQNFLSKLSRLGGRPCLERADIGTLLRSNVWNPAPDTFIPQRHHPSRLTVEQEETRSLVFGCGRHRCIAASWAPMAAGIISAAILDRVSGNAEYSVRAGPQIGRRDGWDGWQIIRNVRESS